MTVEAVKWYRMAAERGHAQAQLKLGWMFTVGLGVPEDPIEAIRWYRRASEQDSPEASQMVDYLYKSQLGDDAEAVKWYRKAAEQGSV